MEDEIPAELWRVKDRIAEEAHHNMKSLFERLKRAQEQSKHPVVNRTHLPRRVQPAKS